MPEVTSDQVKQVLSKINYPGFTRDILSFGVVQQVEVEENRITVNLKFTTKNEETKNHIKQEIQQSLISEFPDYEVHLLETTPQESPAQARPDRGEDPWADRAPIPGIKNIIAVASGKGGVGKSTVSTNLALALAQRGVKVGLMDSDIYGPSIHIMMGIHERPMVTPEQKIIPIEKYGIKMMSMGFLVDSDAPLIWRGPLVMKAVEQFLRDVDWQDLDILVIDLPPGTGDAQLTLVQKTPLSGAVIVTTPQEVALVDARRGLKMFQKVNTRVLGIVENMSYFICPHCKEKSFIFGNDGGARSARQLGVPLLGQVPIEAEVTESGDVGIPIVSKAPESASARAFMEIADKILRDPLFQ
ncbi:MAG: Mrp/NBP35 family ATP-binding protein [Calditrichia bacterium]